MNKTKKITFAVCFGLYAIFAIGISISSGPDKGANIGMAGFFLGLFLFVIGILLCIAKDTREAGSAVLISSGIIFLIGLSICSMHPLNI